MNSRLQQTKATDNSEKSFYGKSTFTFTRSRFFELAETATPLSLSIAFCESCRKVE